MITIEELRKHKPERILDVLPLEIFRHDLHQIYNPDTERGFINNRRHYEWYVAIAKKLMIASVFEVGVRYGYSAICLASFTNASYLGIDNESYERDCIEVAWHNFKCAGANPFLNYYWNNHIEIKKLNFQDYVMADKFFDLIHIDGDHTYEGCYHDLNKIHGHYKYLVVDDYAFKSVEAAISQYLYDHDMHECLILEGNICLIPAKAE